jgi:hypothetical protein
MPENQESLKCPFCLNHCIEPKSGKTRCPVCKAEFEIDDRLECIFADTGKIRLPVNGIVCGSCGLVQSGDNHNYLYCGTGIKTAVH